MDLNIRPSACKTNASTDFATAMALSFVISAYINDHNVCTHYVLTYIPTYLNISNCSVVLVYFCCYIVISKEKTTVDLLPAQLKVSEQDFRLVDGWLCIVSLSYVTQLPIICAYSTMEFWSFANHARYT